jgi:hypothetical protein
MPKSNGENPTGNMPSARSVDAEVALRALWRFDDDGQRIAVVSVELIKTKKRPRHFMFHTAGVKPAGTSVAGMKA